jgi:hypothetical protein
VVWEPRGVDLDVDSNNDGRVAEDDDPIEEKTDLPGVIVPVGGSRAEMIVDVPQGRSATLAITQGADKVRLWTAQTGGTAIPAAGTTIAGGAVQTYWIEAFAPSASMADIAFTLTPTGGTGSGSTTSPPRDTIRATAVVVDLDVDSNNDGKISEDDDPIEERTDDTRLPGRVLLAASGDVDGDSVPDFADGYDIFGQQGSGASAGFAPVILRLPSALDIRDAEFVFSYDDSHPGAVVRTGTAETGYRYEPAAGLLRLWSKDGPISRSKAEIDASGDYIASGKAYPFASLPEAARIGANEWRLYVEAVQPSRHVADQSIRVDFRKAGSGAGGMALSDTVRATVIDWRLVSVDENNYLTPTTTVSVSHDGPVVTITSLSLSNLHLSPDNTTLLGTVQVAGAVDSAICDSTPGDLGKIEEVTVYLGDSVDPLGTVTTNVSKSQRFDSYLKPYDYSGTFSHTFVNVALGAGYNRVTVVAADRVFGYTGSAEAAVEVQAQSPYPYTEQLSVQLGFVAAPSPGAPDPITAIITRGNRSASAVLTETANASMTFRGDTDDLVIVIDPNHVFDPALPDTVEAVVTSRSLDISALDFLVAESSNDSLAFNASRQRTVDEYEAVDFSGYSFAIGETVTLAQSGAGEAHRYMIQLLGPLEMEDFVQSIETDDGPRGIARDLAGNAFIAMKDDGEGSVLHPAVLSTRIQKVGAAAIIKPVDAPLFLGGVVDGFFRHGLWGSVEGLWGILKFGVTAGVKYNPVAIQVRLQTGDTFQAERQAVIQAVGIATDTVTAMARIAQKVMEFQRETIEAIARGDLEELNALGEVAASVIEVSLELMLELAEHMANLTPYQKGEVIGQILYEVAEAVVTAGTAKLAKLGAIEKVQAALKAGKFSDNASPVIAKVFQTGGKFLEYMDLLADATNKMCFVAGTTVVTDRGLIAIEYVTPGDRVLSRDPVTGDQGYKPVLETFVTHPATLYSVWYCLPGAPAAASELLVCTGEHPFYVVDRNAFVPAAELQPGDALKLADGTTAVVAMLARDDAPVGSTFTTYNFAVQDYHTYFVGPHGVWVHNTGGYCDFVKGEYWKARKIYGDSITDAVKKTTARVYRDKGREWHTENELFEVLGSLGKHAAKADQKLPATLWTKGRFDTAAQNIGYHFDKHVILNVDNSKPDGVDDLFSYIREGHRHATKWVGVKNDALPADILRKRSTVWEDGIKIESELILDLTNGHFTTRVIQGPNTGALRTFFKAEGNTRAEWLVFWAKKK